MNRKDCRGQRTPTEIEFNADIGEGFGVWPAPAQPWRSELMRGGSTDPGTQPGGVIDDVLRLVSTVNLACGFHAGDPYLIKRYVAAAKAAGCTVGAHPSYPDIAGFGLRYMEMPPDELAAVVQYQLGALDGFLRIEGMTLHHVKCHGALYNRAAEDQTVADALADAVAAYRSDLPLYGLPGSCLEHAAARAGVPFVGEAFADRAYYANGTLVDRRKTDAMVLDPEAVAERVLWMASSGTVVSVGGDEITLSPQTICFHADTHGVVDFLRQSSRHLQDAGIRVSGRG